VPVFAILSLVALNPFFSSSPFDPTWHAVAPTIYAQMMLNLSIFAACTPSLKRVLDAFRSGTAAVAIEAPYDITVSGATALGDSGSRSKRGSKFIIQNGLSSNPLANGGGEKGGRGGGGGGGGGGKMLQDIEMSRTKFGGGRIRQQQQ
jgi:hypothetical protein